MVQRDGAGRVGVREAQAPRQEYVDAFDDAVYGRGVVTPGAASATQPSSRKRHRAERGGRGPDRQTAGRRQGGGWGWALTGVASAAVVTVLAVVVVGQVTDLRRADQADRLSHSAPEGTADASIGGDPAPAPDAADGKPGGGEPTGQGESEPSYDELMRSPFPLDPDLTASGELVPVPGSDPAPDPDATTLVRYRVDVERGLGWDPETFAEAVHRTLNDDRSWSNSGERSFARVSFGSYDFVVTLASPGTTADWCARSGLDTTEDNVSCNSSNTERVMINAWRWAQGSTTYGDDILGYRQMLLNHEVGHRLTYGHLACPAEGALAPVMMQQTKFLTTDGVTCRPNPWPHPEAHPEAHTEAASRR